MSEQKKEIAKSDDNNKEPDWREQLVYKIAGDNEILKNVVRFLTHPLVMTGSVVAFFYWLFIKDKRQKEEIEKLLKENEAVKESLKKMEKKFDELKTSHDKLKEDFQKTKEENGSGFGMVPHQNMGYKTKRYHSAYLD